MASIFEDSHLGVWDLVVIVVYSLLIIAVGIWSSWRRDKSSLSGYFLASRNMHWLPVGASLFATNIGSGHFIGLAGAGAAAGVSVAWFEIWPVTVFLLLGWVFVPVYIACGIYTMPEYLKERFGGQRICVFMAVLSLTLYVLIKISAELYAGALFIQMALNKNSTQWLYISVLILLAMSAIFTIAGGLNTVMWTDFVQTIFMMIGISILAGITYYKVGGLTGLIEKYPYAISSIQPQNSTCGLPRSDFLHIMRTIEPGKADLPWTGLVFGLTINAIWYLCFDQVMVQRTLASRNILHAKAGCIVASYLKVPTLFALILPGMAARILFPDRVACADPDECIKICGSPGGCTNIAYIELVLQLMPPGLSGLMMSVMIAAIMSSLTSIFNSASTIFTIDIWTKVRKDPSNTELLIVGRCFVLIIVILSVVWIPVIQNAGNSQLFGYVQTITGYLVPPICAVFLLAIFWKRANEQGAFWGLMTGFIIGITRFVLEFTYPIPPCGYNEPDLRPEIIKLLVDRVHYLHFACILFLICIAATVTISLCTPPLKEENLYRLTFWSRNDMRLRSPINNADFENSTTKLKSNAFEMSNSSMSENNISNNVQTAKFFKKEKEIVGMAIIFLKENPKWKRFVEVNAIICATVSIFVLGFFA